MTSRRTLETAGFLTIAAALHVSAAAFMLPDQVQQGDAAPAPPAALSAGGEAVQSMVSEWETPPEIEMPDEPTPPAPEPEPDVSPIQPEAQPVETAIVQPLRPPAPETAPANLPAPPAPMIDPEPLDLPELQTLTTPPDLMQPELTLEASARPQRRPDPKPEPQPERQPQRQQAQRETPRPAPAQPAPQAPGQGGQAPSSSQGGGGGGASPQQQASLMNQWGGQIRSCISRRTSNPRGVRGGQVVLALTVGRDGAIQSIGLAASSGQQALDQAAISAAQRAGRCPAAPAALPGASFPFQLPITINGR